MGRLSVKMAMADLGGAAASAAGGRLSAQMAMADHGGAAASAAVPPTPVTGTGHVGEIVSVR